MLQLLPSPSTFLCSRFNEVNVYTQELVVNGCCCSTSTYLSYNFTLPGDKWTVSTDVSRARFSDHTQSLAGLSIARALRQAEDLSPERTKTLVYLTT